MPGRGALIIGASSPVGRAIARRLALADCRVVGVSLDPLEHDDAALVEHIAVDCSNSSGAGRAVSAAVHVLGRLDVVVLAAAVMPVASAVATTDEQWSGCLETILSGAFYVIRDALQEMTAGGSIVAVSSVNATLAAPGLAGYAAAKAGLEGLVRQLALEYGPLGIRVTAVAPAMLGNADLPKVTEGYPLRRVGTPEDVAAAVTFLASEDAGFITGCVLPVDGGLGISSPAAWLRPDLRERFL